MKLAEKKNYLQFILTGQYEFYEKISSFKALYNELNTEFESLIDSLIEKEIIFQVELWAKCLINPRHKIKINGDYDYYSRKTRKDIKLEDSKNNIRNGFEFWSVTSIVEIELSCERCKSKVKRRIDLYEVDSYYLDKKRSVNIEFIIDSSGILIEGYQKKEILERLFYAYLYLEFNPKAITEICDNKLGMLIKRLIVMSTNNWNAQKIILIIFKFHNFNEKTAKYKYLISKRVIQVSQSFLDLQRAPLLQKDIIVLSNGYIVDKNYLHVLRESDKLHISKLSGTYQKFTSCQVTSEYAYLETKFKKELESIQSQVFIGFGKNSNNFWHNGIEYLPIIWEFTQQNSLKILITNEQFIQYKQILDDLRSDFQTTFVVLKDEALKIKGAVVKDWTVNTAENSFIPMKKRIFYDTELLRAYSDYILSKSRASLNQKFDKIIIPRKKGSRNLKRLRVILWVSHLLKFKVIYPEKLSLYDQIEIFRNARVIIAEGGAALANLIFCRNLKDLLILQPDNIYNDKSVHQILAESLRLKYKIIKCKPMRSRKYLENSEYYAQVGGRVSLINMLKILKFMI